MFLSMFAVHPCPLLPRHRWPRCQERTMALQLRGADRQQQPEMLFASFRAIDPPEFQELRVVAFDRPGHMAVRDGRYSADVEINDANGLVQPKRCAGTILPDYVPAFDTVCQSGRRQGALTRTGRPGPQSRISINHGGTFDNVTAEARMIFFQVAGSRCLQRSGQLDQYARDTHGG